MNAAEPSFEDYVAMARSGYEAFNNGQIEDVLALFDPDVSWTRRPLHPVQGEYHGLDDIADNVFATIDE